MLYHLKEYMPTYEYTCSECKHNWEIRQNMSDEPLKVCPECEQETAQRLISACAFVLKGSGWFNSGGY